MEKDKLRFWFVCFIIFILLPVESRFVDSKKPVREEFRFLADLLFDNEFLESNTVDAVIDIEYDSNLTDYGFPGDGSASDPYRIEDYIIDTTMRYGIKIINTTKHILIQNCSIRAERAAIGVFQTASNTITIENCICKSYDRLGLLASYVPKMVVTNNLFIDNDKGIDYNSCFEALIANNTFIDNDIGIMIENNSTYGVISGNYIYDNSIGMLLTNAPGNQIKENILFNNGIGIILDSTYPERASTNCEISYNLIENTTSFGLIISAFIGQDFSSYNEIHHNSFVNNNLNGNSQAKDDGVENLWSKEGIRVGNYWSDWWGIGSYKINGSAENKDRYPISKPLHTLQTSVPTILIGRAIVFGTFIPVLIIGYIIVNESKRSRKAKDQQLVIIEKEEKEANEDNS
ncbi:MAG: right-handed parallel beta-helix repeat-containing protein [Candidatus Heimdallarchaeota archaeon]